MRSSLASYSPSGPRQTGVWALLRWSLLGSLLWSPMTAWADRTAGDYFVHSLPGAPAGPLLKMHAGYALPQTARPLPDTSPLTPPSYQTHYRRREAQRQPLLLALPEPTHRKPTADGHMAERWTGMQFRRRRPDGGRAVSSQGRRQPSVQRRIVGRVCEPAVRRPARRDGIQLRRHG